MSLCRTLADRGGRRHPRRPHHVGRAGRRLPRRASTRSRPTCRPGPSSIATMRCAQARGRRRASRGRASALGPLHGVPVGIKDIFDTGDMPTEFGSPLWAGRTPRTRRGGGGAAARGRRRDHGQDRDHRIRLFPSRQDPQPARSRAHARRLVERLGRGGGGAHGARRHRLADQRLGDPPGRVLRRGRLQADAWADPAQRRAACCRARSTMSACSRARSRTWRCSPRRSPASTRRIPTRGRWRARRSPPSRRASRRCRRASPSCARRSGTQAEPVTREAFAELVEALGEAVERGRARRRASSAPIDLHRIVMEVEMAHNLHRDYEKGGDKLSAALRQLIERGRALSGGRLSARRWPASRRSTQALDACSTNTTPSSRRRRRARRRAASTAPAIRCSARSGPISARRPSRCRCCSPRTGCRSACSSSAAAATMRASCAPRAGLSKPSSAADAPRPHTTAHRRQKRDCATRQEEECVMT